MTEDLKLELELHQTDDDVVPFLFSFRWTDHDDGRSVIELTTLTLVLPPSD